MNANETEALRLLRIFTQGHYRIWELAGAGNVIHRQEIMTALTGAAKRLPQAKCGVNAMTEAFYSAAGIERIGTMNDQQQAFQAWCHVNGDHLDIAA